ncbi:MAG: PHA/PHB synthase family protein [Xanthobacteraceae bacterium]
MKNVVSLRTEDRPSASPAPDGDPRAGSGNAQDTFAPRSVARRAATAGETARQDLQLDALKAFDRKLHAVFGRLNGGLAPSAIIGAYVDWFTHLLVAPGKQVALAAEALDAAADHVAYTVRCLSGRGDDPCRCALPQDNRFRAPEWQTFPFNVYAHGFLAMEQWWEAATTDVRGVSGQHQAMTTFGARQMLDTVAPSNFVWSNPQVLARMRETGGGSLLQGFANWRDDQQRLFSGRSSAGTEAYRVGETVAVTPGRIVLRTPLAEIIQYAPATEQVRPEPVVIVPAWIMKYYILDLSPKNSLVKYLTEQGFTVFMVSWKNPGSEDRDVGFDDYRTQGILPAIEAATAITGSPKAHAVGYCLGGTLLAAAVAAMARDRDDRLASVSFFAAQADFTEAGELKLFINEAQVAFIEDMMWERGYLDSRQMAGTFQLLRSNDLIWSRVVREYLMGERSNSIDIMAWNADTTRMPFRMHSEYLRRLYLNDELAEGTFEVGGRPVSLHDIRVPIFAVGTEWDHVAPWRSVFKFHILADGDVTFVLTNGGHNAGILSEPGHRGRHFRMATHRHGDRYVDPASWLEANPPRDGSWWPAWIAWLAERSGAPVAPPSLGLPGTVFAPLEPAPGRYVLMS